MPYPTKYHVAAASLLTLHRTAADDAEKGRILNRIADALEVQADWEAGTNRLLADIAAVKDDPDLAQARELEAAWEGLLEATERYVHKLENDQEEFLAVLKAITRVRAAKGAQTVNTPLASDGFPDDEKYDTLDDSGAGA